MTMDIKIELRDVSKAYGSMEAVRDIDLAVRAGECLALVGHNGAGKSTLIKLMLGLITPSRGHISVMGQTPDSKGFDRIKQRTGFLPEQIMFQYNMTGRETLEFYSRLKKAPLDCLDELFTRVDLLPAADNRISTYSKGMRQRLGLAQALIGSPDLLILDEPTSGLDPASRQNVYRIINQAKQAGVTVLISSHALTELDERIDRVAILNRGRLVALGEIAELRREIGLKSEIRISSDHMAAFAEHFSGRFPEQKFMNGMASLRCPVGDKMALIRELMTLNIPIEDIEVIEPSLEQVFMAYTDKDQNSQEVPNG